MQFTDIISWIHQIAIKLRVQCEVWLSTSLKRLCGLLSDGFIKTAFSRHKLFAVLQPVELLLRYTVRDLKAFGKRTASQLSDGFRNRNFHFCRLCFRLFRSISLQEESVAKSVSLFKEISEWKVSYVLKGQTYWLRRFRIYRHSLLKVKYSCK